MTSLFLFLTMYSGGCFLCVLLYRARLSRNLYFCWFLGLLFSFVLYNGIAFQLGVFSWVRAASFAFMFIPFFHILNMAATARRVRICVALFQSSDGLSQKDLIHSLRLSSMTNHRLKILQQFCQVKIRGNRIILVRSEFLVMARVFNLVKKILGIPELL